MAPRHDHRPVLTTNVGTLTTYSSTITITRTTVLWIKPSSTLKRVTLRNQVAEPIFSQVSSYTASESDIRLDQSTKIGNLPSNEEIIAPTLSPTSSPPISTSPSLELKSPLQTSFATHPVTHYDHRVEASTASAAVPDYRLTPPATFYRMEGGNFELPDVPASVQLVLFACLGVGALWSALVWVIALPRVLPKEKRQTRNVNEKGTNKKAWWKCIWGRRQKPSSSPSKYAPLPSGSSVDTQPSTGAAPTTAKTSATPERATESPIRLRKLAAAGTRQTPPSPAHAPWRSSTPASSITSASYDRHHRPDSSPTPTSPANTFLLCPSKPRSSSEYLAAHHAFFSKPLPNPPPPATTIPSCPSSYLSLYPSRSVSPCSNLDALEAQNEDDVAPPRSRSTRGVLHIADGVEKTGGKLWTTGWVGAVEEGVNKAVDAMVRWTEDDGAEEGLLLPIGRRST